MTIPEAIAAAWEHRRAGRLPQAEALCRQVLAVDPANAEALHLLGTIALAVGRPQVAERLIRTAIERSPAVADYQVNLASALGVLGDFAGAAGACREAIRLQPGHAHAHYNLGKAEEDQGHWAEAMAAFRAAISLEPGFAAAHESLGSALHRIGQSEEAIRHFQTAIALAPEMAVAHHNLGAALGALRREDEALVSVQTALRLAPENAAAWNDAGGLLKAVGRMDEAMACYRRAWDLQPSSAAIGSNVVFAALFHSQSSHATLREDGARWQERHGAPRAGWIAPHGNRRDPARRLKVGYVSPDFRGHVITHFLLPLLEAHDHAQFAIHCFASVRRPDALTERLRAAADVWCDVLALSDEALVRTIRDHEIDILVDLTQHMADNRLPVFAGKPAPVQVAWLGHPGSTGLAAMDYRFTDARMEPEGAPWSESVEQPVRLPDSWFCFDPIDEYPLPAELPASRTGQVTFGCLNNFCKTNEAVWGLWAKVLRATPGSRLLLRCPQGQAAARVVQFFAGEAIGADRLELVSWIGSRVEFMDTYGRLDLCLDPFPYNGGTTTCEALWMGVPVLTLPGTSAVSRIGLSILTALGHPEWAAASEAEFVAMAAALAGDLPRLAALRRTLRAEMKASRFMDASRFARAVEDAYRAMWRSWCATAR